MGEQVLIKVVVGLVREIQFIICFTQWVNTKIYDCVHFIFWCSRKELYGIVDDASLLIPLVITLINTNMKLFDST